MAERHLLLALVTVVVASLAGCADAGAGGPAGLDDVPELGNASFLAGQVVDVEIVPIQGVDVGVAGADLWTTTDATGRFQLGPLEPGTYTVIAEKAGYTPVEQDVNFAADGSQDLMLVVEPVASDVPYHETAIYQAYVMCHVVVLISESGGLNAPCAAVIDLVVPNTAPDNWVFPFAIENPGFTSLALEMTWRTQQFGHDGLMQLTTKGRAEASGTGVQVGGTVYGDTMGPPFHAILHAGDSYWENSDGPVIFYPEPNETESFELLVAGGGGNTSVPGVGLFLEFRPTVYVTAFYNRAATVTFTALPDE